MKGQQENACCQQALMMIMMNSNESSKNIPTEKICRNEFGDLVKI